MNASESRALASWRVHACAAGLFVGAQVFLFGAGIAMPVAINGEWIAALAALPAAALVAFCARRKMAAPKRRPSKPLYLLLALTLLGSAAFALAALVSLAGQTLLPQTRAFVISGMTLAACALCARSGGVSRLCFALRYALPLALAALIALALPDEGLVRLFPLLGAGAAAVGAASACMLGAAAAGLVLMLPPEGAQEAGVPRAGFFVWRMALGALLGAALVFMSSALTAYPSVADAAWGARLRITAQVQPHAGLLQTALTLCQITAALLLCSGTLEGGARALCIACPRLKKGGAGFWLPVLALGACLGALLSVGFTAALFAAPLLAVPMAALMVFSGRMG